MISSCRKVSFSRPFLNLFQPTEKFDFSRDERREKMMRKVHFRLFLSFSRSEKDRSNFSPAFAHQKGQTFLGTLFWVGKVPEKFAEAGRENNGKMMRMAAVFVTLSHHFLVPKILICTLCGRG